MKLGLAEILENAGKITDKKARMEYLKKNDSQPLQLMIRMAFDKNLKWALPDTDPPYKPCQYLDQEGLLYSEVKKFYLFFEGGHPTLKQIKREQMFIQLLESVMPEDAKLILAVKNKKLPYKWLTKAFANEMWPGIAA